MSALTPNKPRSPIPPTSNPDRPLTHKTRSPIPSSSTSDRPSQPTNLIANILKSIKTRYKLIASL
ncbi:MAG: hypothetical protein ACK5CM_02515 [Pseudanabaena sp.]